MTEIVQKVGFYFKRMKKKIGFHVVSWCFRNSRLFQNSGKLDFAHCTVHKIIKMTQIVLKVGFYVENVLYNVNYSIQDWNF